MAKRSILILSLTFAFLMSAWGNVITAAFCPHYLANQSCAHKLTSAKPQQVQRQESCHHDLDDMEMGDMQMDEKSETDSDIESSRNSTFEDTQIQVVTKAPYQLVIDLPIETCGHCRMHSQPASGTATLDAIDSANTLVDTSPLVESSTNLPSSFIDSIAPLEHGPPGNLPPRHVLINLFRI
jgi:hypothetical protein